MLRNYVNARRHDDNVSLHRRDFKKEKKIIEVNSLGKFLRKRRLIFFLNYSSGKKRDRAAIVAQRKSTMYVETTTTMKE